MAQIFAQTEQNEFDRKLTDPDPDLNIPEFSPDQLSAPVVYVEFNSRATHSPAPHAMASGGFAPATGAAGRPLFPTHPRSASEDSARRPFGSTWRRAVFIRELKGAIKFAGLCLVFAFAMATWVFLAAVLGQGIVR